MYIRRFFVLARAFGLCCGLMCACAHAVAQPGADPLGAAKASLHLSAASIVNLDIDRTAGQPLSVVGVPIDGQLHTLQLVPNRIRTPGYELLEVGSDGVAHPAKAGVENSLIGRVADMPGAEIAGGMMPDGLYCTILLPDGTRRWIESIESRVPGARPGDHIIYRGEDVVMGNYGCGNLAERAAPVVAPPFQPRDPATFNTAVLACDADFEFYTQYGSVSLVQSRITLVINTMNLQYRRDVGIKHLLGSILVRTATPQPYTATDSAGLVTQVRNEWNANQGGVSRNVVQMFTNKTVSDNNGNGTITIGRAFNIGHICDDQSYCFVWSNFNNNFASATDLSAHELGHLWDACHCACDGGTAATRYTMNPLITSINKFGPGGANSECGSNNISEITTYRILRFLPPPFGVGCLGSVGDDAAANDACGNAVTLAANATVAMSNVLSTTDGPVSSCRSLAGNDVWYSFTAPCDGVFAVDTCNTSFDTVLTAYTGFCGAMTEVPGACDDDMPSPCAGVNPSRISFAVTRGTFYLIKLSGFNNATGTGFLTTSMSGCPAPGNDSCSNATSVTNGFPVAFSTVGASTDGPIESACNNVGNTQVSQDVWFRFVAPCSGTVRVSMCGADFDSRVAVYFGGCPSGPNTAIACNDDNGPACTGTRASVDFFAAAGSTYTIRVGGYSASVGSGILRVDSLVCPRPANDDCVNATTVSNGSLVTNDFFGATNDGGADCGSSALSRDIWFDFTAPVDGTLTVSTCGTNDTGGQDSGVDTVMSVHAGCPGTISNQIACNDDNTGQCGATDVGLFRDSVITLAMAGGQNVKVRVANYANGTPPVKPITFRVSFAAANDNCAAAPTIGEGLGVWYNNNATDDGPTTPGGACGGGVQMHNDVWYQYVPACTGTSRISLCGSPFDTVLAVYAGSCASPGLPIACSDDNGVSCTGTASSLDMSVTAGQPYLVRMGSYFSGSTGTGPRAITCAASLGACCAGATCSLTVQSDCAAVGQRFAGSGTTCNAGSNTTPCCNADFNQNGTLEVQDIFDFLNAWFAGDARADINGGGLAVQDIFDFLNAWFAGC